MKNIIVLTIVVSGISMSCEPNLSNKLSSDHEARAIAKAELQDTHQFIPEHNQVIKTIQEKLKAQTFSVRQAPATGLVLVLILGVIISWKSKIWTGYDYA